MSTIKISRCERTEALIFDTSLAIAGGFTGSIASPSPLLCTSIYVKRPADVGEGDFKWVFIVTPAGGKPFSKGQKYWMAKVRDVSGLTNVYGCKEETLIDPKDDEDLLCSILLAEVEDMEKLHKVMCLPRSPKRVMEDMKWDSKCWVRGMLGKLMNEGCLKGGLVAWDVVFEAGLHKAQHRMVFNQKNYLPKGYPWTIDLRNEKESDVSAECFARLDSRGDADLAKEWLFRRSESPELEDHASFVTRMNAYWDDDNPTSESSRIDDEGGTDKQSPDPSPSLESSKTCRPRAREVVAKGKRTEAAGVTESVPPDCPPSSRIQPRAAVVVPSKSKSGYSDSDSDAENQAKSSSKSPTLSNFKTPPEYPVGHGKRKRLVDPDSPSPIGSTQLPASKRV